jgi:hypothetical protein
VDEIHELALDEFDAVEVESSCTLVERTSKLVAPAPGGAGGGWYTDINFDCFSPCECDKCVTVDHRAVMSISSKLMPPIDIRWTFTPTDLFEECGYHECEVNLNVRQR